MAEFLSSLKNKRFVGVKELADEAAKILRNVGSDQHKKTVAEYPNERTIRFYINEGLLPPRIEMQDQSAVYGYEHILVLLTIKKLQADGLPISVIKSLIAGKSIRELEKLLGERVMVFTDRADLDSSVQSSGKEAGEEVVVLNDAAARDDYLASPPRKNTATEYLESVLFNKSKGNLSESRPLFSRIRSTRGEAQSTQGTRQPGEPNQAELQQPDRQSSWTRIQIEPGLELHVQESYRAPSDQGKRDLVTRMIEKILRQLP